MLKRAMLIATILIVSLTLLSGLPLAGAQETENRFSSFSVIFGYNTFSAGGDNSFTQHPEYFLHFGGFTYGVRFLLNPAFLGERLAIGVEWLGLTVAGYRGPIEIVQTGKRVTQYDEATFLNALAAYSLVATRKFSLQLQGGLGFMTYSDEFSEMTVSARLVGIIPMLPEILTLDPEIGFVKGLGAYGNAALTIAIGLTGRW